MSTTTITTISDLLEKYNVSLAQLRKATRQVDTKARIVYYLVESQTTDARYEVCYNREFGCLQCKPHADGPTCMASAQGIPCWHKRAALAREAEYAILKLAAQQAEQFEVEATEEYQREHLEWSAGLSRHEEQEQEAA